MMNIIERVREQGYCVLEPGSFHGYPQLKADVKLFLEHAYQFSQLLHYQSFGIRVHSLLKDSEVRGEVLTRLHQWFQAPLLRQIAHQFFDEEYLLNNEIFLSETWFDRDQESSKPPFAMHFDKLHTLKFFVYMSDVGSQDGPLTVVPFTHHRNWEIRTGLRRNSVQWHDVHNLVSCENAIQLCAPEGTMIVFDSDVSHQAGAAREGCERLVMRAHSRTVTEISASQCR